MKKASSQFWPVNVHFVTEIIKKERPDGILLAFGGQTALNCGTQLHQQGILSQYGVQVLGTSVEAIMNTEDRDLFVKELNKIDLKVPVSQACETMDEAGQKFLGRTWVEDDEYLFGGMEPKKVKLDSVRFWPYNYATVKGEVRQDGQLLHFSVNKEEFVAYAAHGTYSFHSLIVDRATGKAVRLADLMDTAGIGRVMIRALEELEKNKENGNSTECLSDEYTKCLPEPDGFTMDSNRTVVTAFYNIYSVQAYGCGMLFVDMPVDWLSGQVTLTPYGKKIFGIEEGKKK